MNKKQCHLEMIQGVINRLSHNSFLLKGWTVALISALFVLGVESESSSLVYFTYFPPIVFWCLDAYFLRQERLFRALYNHVRGLMDDDIDYSMDVSNADIKGISRIYAFFSTTLFAFYGMALASIAIVTCISM